jgi:hypothetical protein
MEHYATLVGDRQHRYRQDAATTASATAPSVAPGF